MTNVKGWLEELIQNLLVWFPSGSNGTKPFREVCFGCYMGKGLDQIGGWLMNHWDVPLSSLPAPHLRVLGCELTRLGVKPGHYTTFSLGSDPQHIRCLEKGCVQGEVWDRFIEEVVSLVQEGDE